MEYNTNRGDMQFREYGRTITKLIGEVCNMEESEARNEAASALVNVMGQVSGMSTKDQVSYHKLWDHLMILSEFRLESAWPFQPEELELLKSKAGEKQEKPIERLPYKNNKIGQRHYGENLEAMMKQLKELPDGEEYDALAMLIAQQAKRSYMVWNGELPDDNIVVAQMTRMSGDSRVEQKLKDKAIVVNPATMPVESTGKKKKRKKK